MKPLTKAIGLVTTAAGSSMSLTFAIVNLMYGGIIKAVAQLIVMCVNIAFFLTISRRQ